MTRGDHHDPTPAIRREFREIDRTLPVKSTTLDDVSFNPGMGDSGRRVEVVEHTCPAEHCSFDRMIRLHRVDPVSADRVEYWCLNPNCVHYVSDHLSWACKGSYPQRDTTDPAVIDAVTPNHV